MMIIARRLAVVSIAIFNLDLFICSDMVWDFDAAQRDLQHIYLIEAVLTSHSDTVETSLPAPCIGIDKSCQNVGRIAWQYC